MEMSLQILFFIFKLGYYGTTCEKNHCGVCVHGKCVLDEFNEMYECFCANGYTGSGCTEDINECKHSISSLS